MRRIPIVSHKFPIALSLSTSAPPACVYAIRLSFEKSREIEYVNSKKLFRLLCSLIDRVVASGNRDTWLMTRI
jgi:hypothetical protein